MDHADEDRIIARGRRSSVAYAVRANGKMPAKKFIDNLTESEQRRLYVLFERLTGYGEIRNTEQFKHEADGIYGFKRGQIRVACFQVRRTWFLTHGFRKTGRRWRREELQRAKDIRDEHMAR